MKEVHPEYSDRVAVLSVGVDPTETGQKILSYKESEGFSWDITPADVQMLQDYNVTRQAAYMALDSNGSSFPVSHMEANRRRTGESCSKA